MRGVFYKQLDKRNFDNKSEEFDNFPNSVRVLEELDDYFSCRLRDIMLGDQPSPWTGKELYDLTGNYKCNCSIREALIAWTGVVECPSQQEICNKGEDLICLF